MTEPSGPGDRSATAPARDAPSAPGGGARVIDLADLDWCWSQLRATRRGVLSSRDPRRPGGVDVRYSVRAGQVVVPVDDDSQVLRLLVGQEVTLDLTGRTGDGRRWVVRLTGLADLAPATRKQNLEPSRLAHPARGLDGSSGTLLVPVGRLRGYHETLLGDPPAAAAPAATEAGPAGGSS